VLALSIVNHNDYWPFHMVALIFISAFGTLALSFWPYMIPFVITIDQAAAPQSSLAFMFWGCGVFVFPLMLLYTVISYRVFRTGSTDPTIPRGCPAAGDVPLQYLDPEITRREIAANARFRLSRRPRRAGGAG
jgi:hypothetical protein